MDLGHAAGWRRVTGSLFRGVGRGGRMNKLAYKAVALGSGTLSGVLAGMVFKQVWKLVAGDDDAPDATDEDRSWAEVLFAAALQGAVFGVAKAAVQRAGAEGVRKATGHWPDDSG